MKTTTHKLLALIVLLVFIACSGTKKVTETETKQSVKSETEVSKDLDVKKDLKLTDKSETFTDKEIQTIENLTDLWEKNITEYDTEKAIIPGTNKPPVKSETTYINKKVTDKVVTDKVVTEVKNDIELDYTEVLKSQLDSMKKVNDKLVSDSEVKEIPFSWGWVWWLIGGVVVLVIVFVRKSI